MIKKGRIFFSAALGIILLVSMLIFSSSLKAKTCPDEPESLFSLYMDSELVVLAEIRSEKDLEITDESEDGFSAEVERNLDIIETFKGANLREILFTRSEYREKVKPAENSQNLDEIVYYTNFGRNGAYNLAVGKRYLFFLNKNADTEQYQLSSYQGIRNIGENSENIYKDRFAELKAILANKENQSANFAEWLVRLIEDPETIWDGSYVLNSSFYSQEYEQENSEDAEIFEESEEFSSYSSKIAKSLTAAQKERISKVLYKSLEKAVYQNDADSPDRIADYDLINIASSWNKQGLAMYAFNLLQTVDPNDSGKMIKLMDFVNAVVGDEQLYEILSQYRTASYEANAEEETAVEAGPAVEAENAAIQSDESVTAEIPEPEINETAIETVVDEVAQTEEAQNQQLTPAQPREKLFGDFVNRYQTLLSRNFEAEESDEQ